MGPIDSTARHSMARRQEQQQHSTKCQESRGRVTAHSFCQLRTPHICTHDMHCCLPLLSAIAFCHSCLPQLPGYLRVHFSLHYISTVRTACGSTKPSFVSPDCKLLSVSHTPA